MYAESSTGVASAMIPRNTRDTVYELCFVNGQTIKKSSFLTQDFAWSLCTVDPAHLCFVLVLLICSCLQAFFCTLTVVFPGI